MLYMTNVSRVRRLSGPELGTLDPWLLSLECDALTAVGGSAQGRCGGGREEGVEAIAAGTRFVARRGRGGSGFV